jgi:predicted acetyltransferase
MTQESALDFSIFFTSAEVEPSGYVKIAIESDHRNSGFTH